ncbi:GNAT family N-acetyltransferase [Denitrobaculum tricleocarpae]|uniref:GNAT family N-acetyltransferase n=2 Tax=Denitrobaculum tricleocarpae TaxID=2591009 RepID=A0A545TQC0_9PROT|nr:GNAT family N-acetyltransferase [Denitrobaculum tricleocarpae]
MLQLRSEVFVVEQESLFSDIDGLDRVARHLLLYKNNVLIGYLRFLGPEHRGDGNVAISRVVLRKNARGQGLGRVMMEAALSEVRRMYAETPVTLSAQIDQEAFYSSLGFVRVPGEPYDDAGILHIDMVAP